MEKIGNLLIEEDESKKPICPYCEKEIDEIQYIEQRGLSVSGAMMLFIYPHCLKVLGGGVRGI